MKMNGIVKAIVVSTDDPIGLNRVKIRIPSIHGAMTITPYQNAGENAFRENMVEEDSLPWAEVLFPHGQIVLPDENSVVGVMFINGDISQPIVIGSFGYEYNLESENDPFVYQSLSEE